MNRIYKNDADFVVVEYENTGDYEKDYGIESFLRSADFDHDEKKGQWVFVGSENLKVRSIIKAIVDFFEHEMGLAIELDQHCRKEVEEEMVAADVYAQAQVIGRKVIDASSVEPELPDFFKRTLMPYQRKSVEHVIQVGNAANFSVPGSGKTTITYAAISSWINDGIINKIMVVGPSASFGPWEEEFALCFGRPPKKLRLSRGIIHELESIGSVYELFICGYQLMANYAYQINRFLKKYKVALIIDESHNIKNPTGGARANAALQISPSATRRIILSGTPMPNDHRDLWTQITFLWPFNEPLGKQVAFNDYVRSNGIGKYRDIIGTLFCRIKKRDLDLPDPKWKEIVVPLNKYQRKIYDIIAVKTLKELSDYQDQATIQQFRMGKMVRLIQAASNPSLLFETRPSMTIGFLSFSR